MRAFTAAAVQVGPVSDPLSATSIAENARVATEWVRRCVENTGAELVVLPESVTTGFTPNLSAAELGELVGPVPGAITDPYAEVAEELGIHLCFGTYEAGGPGVVYNSAVLLGPTGKQIGLYRKTHPFHSESVVNGGWVTPGNEVCVVETDLGRIGMIVCFDGDYPELSRIQAVRGAEVICRPTALLRSADIWDLTSRARAYDNHVYVVGANCIGIDPGGVHYFGNSHIVSPIAEVLAKAASHPGWVAARLDPEEALASLTPGSNIRQGFDHLRDRNLDLIVKHRDDLERPAETSFPH